MLNFYINRAGGNLNPSQKRILEKAKTELRKALGKSRTYLCAVSEFTFLLACL